MERLIDQRIRNRIIEMLEWVIECEHTAPDLGLEELVNAWDDLVDSPFQPDRFPDPTYTDEERQSLRAVSAAMDAFCVATPQKIIDQDGALMLSEWKTLTSRAKDAYTCLMNRGRLPEDRETQG